MSPARRHRLSLFARARVVIAATMATASLLAGCAATTIVGEPSPTPADILGITDALRSRDVIVSDLVSGDAGCEDPEMIAAAIAFSASGAGQASPLPVRIFIFRNDRSYEKLRSAVDACARAWVSDPATFEAIDVSPYVMVGQGPWPAGFRDAIRAALLEASGVS
jgi:hypothetical protein